MNISKRDIKMLFILFGVVIFVLCYFLVYARYTEENEFLAEDIDMNGSF
jgi:heme/copper-type cytochrome/quinol oxidase subunit 2